MTHTLTAFVLFGMTLGCAGAPRPVPTGGQQVATIEGGGLVLSVPRLDSGAYPDDVLDVSAAVYVAIENKGPAEVQVSIEDFSLAGPDGTSFAPMAPQLLAAAGPPAGPGRRAFLSPVGTALAVSMARTDEATASIFAEDQPIYAGRFVPPPAPAFRGGMGGGGAYRGGSVYRGGWGGGAYRGSGYRGGAYRGGIYGGGGYRRGYQGWGGMGMGYYGWWGVGPYAPYWWGQGSYARSRDDAMRYGLPASRLPAGGKVAGFLYFPRRGLSDSGGVLLRWQARDAQSHAVMADMRIPLEMNED